MYMLMSLDFTQGARLAIRSGMVEAPSPSRALRRASLAQDIRLYVLLIEPGGCRSAAADRRP